MQMEIEQYGVFEAELQGRTDGNPFVEYEVKGIFTNGEESWTVSGFYDGNGRYVVRFMPEETGEYSYRIFGSCSEKELRGSFTAAPAKEGNHGMMKAVGEQLFYADGTPYYSVGTTCYVFPQQTEELQRETLDTLKNSAFNKIRFCVFPKHYDYNFRDPVSFPYEGTPVDNSGINKETFGDYTADSEGNCWDFSRFRPEYFQNLEKNIRALGELGIEADIILFHPYDRWGFSKMPAWADDLYLKYVMARFSAFRNVWWSLANEYDFCRNKTVETWEHYARVIQENDPYGHLRSIHNGWVLYDFSRPWVTHCSIQRQGANIPIENVNAWRKAYHKPVVIDEMCYEGNIEQDWGNITARDMLRRMWTVMVCGGYPGHGECYDLENVWWSHGGRLHGESWKRFGFLYEIWKECGHLTQEHGNLCANEDGTVRLYYGGEHCPDCKTMRLTGVWEAELLDTWKMTRKNLGEFTGFSRIPMAGQPDMALLLKKKG